MKKLSIIAAFVLTLISTAFAGKPANSDFKGMENFSRSFPGATDIAYKVTDTYTLVNFTWHHLQLQAFYDQEGNYIGTSRKIAIADLPLTYLLNIKRDYPGYQTAQAIEFDHADTGLSYYVTVVAPEKTYVLEVSGSGTISVFKKMKN